MVPYAIQTYQPTSISPPDSLQRFYLLPGEQDPGEVVTHSSWLSDPVEFQLAQASGGNKTVVRLLYAPKATCRAVGRCPGVLTSVGVIVKLGFPGPGGTLIGRSGASGDYPITSVSGNVNAPYEIDVYVNSTPNGQDVHVSWDLTCSKGGTVRGASGGWDDTTPVDGTGIPLPIFEPDSCIVSASAQLSSGGGSISLALYDNPLGPLG
jgi:hypothetical protein